MANNTDERTRCLVEQERLAHAVMHRATQLLQAASWQLQLYNDGETDMATSLGDADVWVRQELEEVARALTAFRTFRAALRRQETP